jgi:hypothetical protein
MLCLRPLARVLECLIWGHTVQGSIAQAAALAIFGNDILHGHSRLDFWPTSTVFAFCKRVRFVTFHGDPKTSSENLIADGPIQWVSKLQGVGTIGLRIHHFASNNPQISDRMSVGFVGGGGRWLIETRHAKLSDLWEARWLVGNREDPERKIWEVTYCRVDQDRAHLPLSSESLTTLKNDLEVVLSRSDAFATRKNLESFAKAFRSARNALVSDEPLSNAYHTDLAPTSDIPLEAKQLLAAAQIGWVFGGMGSWNDIGFEGQDQQEYVQISDDLFSLLNQAICSAVNSSPFDANRFPE